MEPSDWNFSFLGETVVGFWHQHQQLVVVVVVVVVREMMMMQQQHWFDA
jgi:hypothetical protein